MKDEIIEILECFSSPDINFSEMLFNRDERLLDYILILKAKNERLKETNVYCNRTDCSGRIKDSRKYDSVYQEKEDYKSRCEKNIKIY